MEIITENLKRFRKFIG